MSGLGENATLEQGQGTGQFNNGRLFALTV